MQFLSIEVLDLKPLADLGQLNVIYNVLHPSLLLHIKEKLNVFLILIQEIKKDI
jgi:hypothetical protein